ncbi:MAG TPA: alpha/beta fold hydrolase [Streptosporangiaceae bacterium]
MEDFAPGAETAGGFDPSGMLRAAGDLVTAAAAGQELAWLGDELMAIAEGRSSLWFDAGDHRFDDPAWQANPFFHVLGQGYCLFEQWLGRLADDLEVPWDRQARARYLASIVTAALAPTNFFWTNPAAIKLAFETGGRSVLRGGRNMLRDLASGGMPRMVNRAPFGVGEQLACTPGAVIYRDEIFELLQYTPVTPAVRSRPLLMVPPELNRYYVLDLSPGRSLAEYAVASGIQTFMIVWRNPQADLGHGRWGMDDYLAAQVRAAEVVRKVTRTESVNWLGLCAGGITTALLAGYYAARGEPGMNSATFLVTMLTNTCPNIVGQLSTGPARDMLRVAADAGQVIPGDMLRATFAWLRPNDLVFNYLVSGWLLGQDPPAFDVLAWNDDATAMSARFALDSAEALVGDRAAVPGGLTVLGTPIDLAKVDCDTFYVAGYTDHISPWRACYAASQVMGGDREAKEMVVVRSGHIQSFVNPVEKSRYDYWTAPPVSPDPDQWLAGADLQHGSWWPRWSSWLLERSGPEKKAPATPGNRAYPPLGPAPGTYVHG